MDRMKTVAKEGWHPGSVRSEHKHINQVAGWVGHGKEPKDSLKAPNHTSRPLASLKDPDSFGPPPKNVNFHGDAVVAKGIAPERRGLSGSLPAGDIRTREAEEQEAERAIQKPAPPPVPCRANTTGLRTEGLPTPPVRRLENGESSTTSIPTTKPKPSLPPRLPPRQNSHPTENAPSPPPDYNSATQQQQPSQDSHLNRGALGRLGKAGVSVPGLGIGGGQESSQAPTPWRRESSSDTPSTSSPPTTQSPSMSGLRSRFGPMTTTSPTSSSSPHEPPAPSSSPPSSSHQGTSLAQKQAALSTAAQFRKDPSSITLADARSSAATANNFRERHGEQVAAGWKGANALNQKYDVANRAGGIAGQHGIITTPPTRRDDGPTTPTPMRDNNATSSSGGVGNMSASSPLWGAKHNEQQQQNQSAFRKPPPPPLPVKRTGTGSGGLPPPIPMGSKPRT